MKKYLLPLFLFLSITLSFNGCAEAVVEGTMQGTVQVAVEAGVAKTVLDKEEYERRKTINKAQANVSWWKFQKLFGFGPLAEQENQE